MGAGRTIWPLLERVSCMACFFQRGRGCQAAGRSRTFEELKGDPGWEELLGALGKLGLAEGKGRKAGDGQRTAESREQPEPIKTPPEDSPD